MTRAEIIAQIKEEVKNLTSYLTDPTDYENAVDEAARETGWSYPISGNTRTKWQLFRSKRHLFFYLWSESAHKFKYKQINLQHRFDHYERLIKYMDEVWEKALMEDADLNAELSGADQFELFGTKIDAGFAYESQTGRDITYDEDQIVIHHPNESS
jgi:hypothetical protein